MGVDILLVLYKLITHALDKVSAAVLESGNAVDDVDYEMETVNIVLYAHIEGRCDSSLFFIAENVEVTVLAAIGKLVDEGCIAVVSEYDGLILGKEIVVCGVGKTVGNSQI